MANNIISGTMPNLVFVKDNEPVTNSYAIAKWANHEHYHVVRIIKANIDTLKEFNSPAFKAGYLQKANNAINKSEEVSFETYPVKTKTGTQQIKAAILNEEQAMFVILSMRNNEKTKQFKVELIKAFKQCREELAKQNQLLTDQEIENTSIDEFCRGYDAGYKKYADSMETAHELESDTGTVSLGLKRNSLVYEYIKLQKKIKANKAQWEQELKEFDSVINSAFELSEDLKALGK
uniref:Regulatory protein n=1 Tax=Siphoviridae sp. ctvyM23 TaxID=2826514 RepID=A0A8S5MIS3_9CAUD|nr:MAG TPA: regulatory protein [Siphoviridae sp. ctvyM23]